MKKFLLGLSLILISSAAVMAQKQNSPVPQAKFNELKHEFGKIPQGIPATTAFTFVNEGKTPLVIEVANASCGCTTPKYPKEPILPGKKGVIEVTYNAEAPGQFVKMVDVKFSQNDRPVNLVIQGEVQEKNRHESKRTSKYSTQVKLKTDQFPIK